MQFRRTKGFSVLEVLVAILFLSLLLLALLPSLMGSVLLGKQSGRVNLAAQLAQQHMELVRGQFVAFVLAGTYQETQNYYQNAVPTQVPNISTNLGAFTLANGGYTRPAQDVVYYYNKNTDSFTLTAPTAGIAGTQSYVVRTLIQADGPVAPCIGAACAGYNTVNTAAGVPDTTDTRLFKKVTVAVYAATAANAIPTATNSFGGDINNVPAAITGFTGTALANERVKMLQIGNPQAEGVRTSEASTANSQTSLGPLAVISTVF
jgi:type II secretory pathway pseudopilin PulG